MAAQDTGGAIRGAVRARLLLGHRARAGAQAGRMRQQGRMWLLWPSGEPLPRWSSRSLRSSAASAAAHALAVGEEQRRRAVDAELAAELEHLVDRVGAARRRVRAPSACGAAASSSQALARSGEHHTACEWSAFSRPDHRVHEDVDRDVVDLRERAARTAGTPGSTGSENIASTRLPLPRCTFTARSSGSDSNLIAFSLRSRSSVRSRSVRSVVDVAVDARSVAGGVGVDDAAAALALRKRTSHRPGTGAGCDALDLRAAELGLERLADLRLVGERGGAQRDSSRARIVRISSSPGASGCSLGPAGGRSGSIRRCAAAPRAALSRAEQPEQRRRPWCPSRV